FEIEASFESAGRLTALFGPSGSGKSTLINLIAGLIRPEKGRIAIDGRVLVDTQSDVFVPMHKRRIGMVFQDARLFPHMSVAGNLRYGRWFTPASERYADIDAVVELLGIGHLLDRRPAKLSGGEMQRVAIGRALVRRPKAMLMDEPIGALDAKLREEMRAEIKRLHIKQGSTTIYVTHDQIEAMSLADRIVIMHEGFIQQVGTPDEVYSHPANLFVAQFVGSPVMNITEASVAEAASAATVTVGDAPAGFEFPSALLSKLNGHAANGGLTLGIRPEGVLVRREAAPGYLPVEAHIIEPLGSFDIVDLKVGSK
ncbi:MAG: ABC transporter ATP-binding protein, partial [Mesorhizobium sp.]